MAARPVITELRQRYPRLRLFLSTTTLTGQQLARRSVADVDAVFYFPFDWTFTVRRTLKLVKPRLFVMVETEIWPNLLRECRRRGIKTLMMNGRISSQVFSALSTRASAVPARAGRRRSVLRAGRGDVATAGGARRRSGRITITGSLKFDSLDPATRPGRGRERVLRFFRLSPRARCSWRAAR